jgi:hypothetical protein
VLCIGDMTPEIDADAAPAAVRGPHRKGRRFLGADRQFMLRRDVGISPCPAFVPGTVRRK